MKTALEPVQFWPDGTRKSTNNAFTAHGYVPGAKAPDAQPKMKKGVRAERAFGVPNGTMNDLGKRRA